MSHPQRDLSSLPIVVIVGPTAAGKTRLSLDLAQRAGAEIVSADSQQVYKGMDIGTGKATLAERQRVRHHLLDVLTPDRQMTAARFAGLADAAIADAAARGVPVVVAGGTGLYVRALLLGLFEGPAGDDDIRRRLAREARELGTPAMWQRLRRVDPGLAPRIGANDLRRIIRALEVWELTGVPMSEHQQRHDHKRLPLRYDARIVGVSPERAELYRRIDARVDQMMVAGLLAEVEQLRGAGYDTRHRSQAAIGYAELHDYLDGAYSLGKAVALIKRNSRRYARRQLSWYRGDSRIAWIDHPDRVDLDALHRHLRGARRLRGGQGATGGRGEASRSPRDKDGGARQSLAAAAKQQ